MYAEVPGRERVLSRQGQTFHGKVTKAACRHNSREAAGIVAAGRKKPPRAAERPPNAAKRPPNAAKSTRSVPSRQGHRRKAEKSGGAAKDLIGFV